MSNIYREWEQTNPRLKFWGMLVAIDAVRHRSKHSYDIEISEIFCISTSFLSLILVAPYMKLDIFRETKMSSTLIIVAM